MAVAKKKVVAKKPVVKKKVAPKTKAPPTICWFKLSTGEELVAYCDTTSVPDILVAYRPSLMMYYQDQIIFTPYGLQAQNTDMFFFPESHVVSFYEVNEEFAVLYQLSRKANEDIAKAMFEQIVFSASQKYAIKIADNANTPEPTDEELETLSRQADNEQFQVVTSLDGIPRSKSQVIDDLVALAERAGKGKNVKA